MNIFASDVCPIKSADNLDSKRVNKMLLESCQMLSTAINEHGGKAPYKSTHKNHPSNIWCRTTRVNFYWLVAHAERLAEIYSIETGKVHKCETILKQLKSMASYIPEGELTLIPNCAANADKGVSFKHLTDIPQAYKEYLVARWNTDTLKPTWKNRNIPDFYKV